MEDKLNQLCGHLNLIVSIGTSNDEEEVTMLNDSGRCQSKVLENRNDEECKSYEMGDRDVVVSDIHREVDNNVIQKNHERNVVDTNGTEMMSIEDEETTNYPETSRTKIGSDMMRDSGILSEGLAATELVDAKADSANETSETAKGIDMNNATATAAATTADHCNIKICNERNQQQYPVPILKKTDQARHFSPRNIKFYKRKIQFSSKLKPIITSHRKQRVVTFSSVMLRTYDIILGDHPNCKFGAPISIGWDYHECNPLSLDTYETGRGERRKMKQLYLNSKYRTRLLKRAGFSAKEISDAMNDVQLIRLQRQESTEEETDTPPFTNGVFRQSLIQVNTKGQNKKSQWSRVSRRLKWGSRRAQF